MGSAAVLEAAFPNGMPAPDSINGELDTLRTRFWIATSLHIDPNNYVYYGNRKGEFFGLWRFNQQDAEIRLKFDPAKPRQLFRFSGINGELTEPNIEQKIYEPRSRPWYKAGEKSEAHTWTSIYIDFRNDDLVATRARHVLDAQSIFQGVVATDLSLRRLNDFVRRPGISKNAVAFIMEFDGNLIASSKTPNIGTLADGSNTRINVADSESELQRVAYAQVREQIASGRKIDSAVTQRFAGPHGEAIELAYDAVRDDAGLDWVIVVAVPRSDFMQGVTSNVKRSVLIGVLGAILAVMLGLGVLEWVGRDLRRLTQAAQDIGQGHTETLLDVYRNDEIGELANTFRQMQQRLRTDMLTGLDNRDVIERNIAKRIEQGCRVGDAQPFAILFIDLNKFKEINDCYGHDAGDRVLVEIGQRLQAATRSEDRVARYAGDEFLIFLDAIPSREAAESVRSDIEEVLRAPLKTVDNGALDGMQAGGAVALACYPEDGDSAEVLIKHSDYDMYERKKKSRSEAAN